MCVFRIDALIMKEFDTIRCHQNVGKGLVFEMPALHQSGCRAKRPDDLTGRFHVLNARDLHLCQCFSLGYIRGHNTSARYKTAPSLGAIEANLYADDAAYVFRDRAGLEAGAKLIFETAATASIRAEAMP